MSIFNSKDIEETLQKADIHQKWEDTYRTEENEKFYERAFDYITRVLTAKENDTILDVGCGACAHSIRLAKRGFSVMAVDCSEHVLEKAEVKLQNSGIVDKIKLQQENILSLSFADRTFDYVLCWGVLMHIPDIEKAISELDRVLKKDGIIVISEGNMFSLQSIILRSIKLFLRKEKATVKKTAAGMEYWRLAPSGGKFLTRQANIKWLKNKFKSKGYTIKKHVSGQFTELYRRFSFGLISKFIHYLNSLWFNYVKIPHLAFGNIIILRKRV